LSELMSRCPFTDGSFIYQARAFYNKIYRVTKLFNDDNCISTGISSGRLKTNIEKYSDGRKQGFNLFPNPASETVFLSSNKSLEGAILTITDIAGKVLVNKVLGSSEDSIELSLNLIEGMYFVSIKKNNETANFKLVIAK
jgi:hypothetical protein